MRIFDRLRRLRPWLCLAALTLALALPTFRTTAQTTQPAATEAAAAAPAPSPAADPTGFNGGPTTPLLQPNSYLSGWVSGAADKNLDAITGGTWKAWAGDKP